MSVVEQVGATSALASFVESKTQTPDEVRSGVRACFLGTLLASVAGASDETAAAVVRTVNPLTGSADQPAAVLGTDVKVPPAWAAFCNTIAAEQAVSRDLGPSDAGAPDAAIVCGTFAVAGQAADDRDLLDAGAAGIEVAARLSAAFAATATVWDVDAVVSRFGAVTAVGRLLGLDHQTLVMAFGIAGGQSGALMAAAGSANEALQRGRAAFDAIEACLIARDGYDASETIVEGRGGAGSVLFPHSDYAPIIDGLGAHWESAALPADAKRLGDLADTAVTQGRLSPEARQAFAACLTSSPATDSLRCLYASAARPVSPA